MMKEIKKIIHALKKAKSVAIFSHSDPDFDAIGSALGLKRALNNMGKKADFICDEEISAAPKKVFGDNFCVKNFDKKDYDLFVSLDNPTPSRCKCPECFSENTSSILIDHHRNLGLKAKYNYINIKRSSCSELVFEVLQKAKIKIDSIVATALYAGLSSDTNSFINSNTNADSLLDAHKLLKLGAEAAKFNEYYFRSLSSKEIEVKTFIYNNFKFDKNICYCLASQDDIKKLKANKRDFSAISSQLITFEKSLIAFSVVEKEPKEFYFSFRSKIGYPTREIAQQLGGGGHDYACAGKICDRNLSVEKVKRLIIKEIKKHYPNM